jgi:solute carrier family 39 (zinc transporter), member 1/2/3
LVVVIGITLVVTSDAFFGTLAIVIVFHQAFEGIALGTRISSLGSGQSVAPLGHHHHGHHGHHHHHTGLDEVALLSRETTTSPVSTARKLFLASGFAFVTPLGMVIGICLLKVFNGNDPSTIAAIGAIDAFSAGILVWVGIVEMWAHDWMAGGEVAQFDTRGKLCCLIGLVGGMGSMSYLGKWA